MLSNRYLQPRACVVIVALLSALVLQPTAAAQEAQKTWIFLTDKLSSAGKTTQAEPGYVSEHAKERRQRRGSHFLPIHDAPISPQYRLALESLGVEIVQESRWLNAVTAFLDPDQRNAVQQLPFVRRLQPVRTLSKQFKPPMPVPVPVAHRTSRVLDCGLSCNQLELVNAVEPLDSLINGQGVKIGFVDTRFDDNGVLLGHSSMNHLSDAGRVRFRSFTADDPDIAGQTDNDWHGFEVASVALGYAPGHLIGPCYGADSVYAAQTEWTPLERNVEEDNFVAGVEWMEARGVDIINSSLGYTTFDPGERSYTTADMDGDTAITTIAFDMAAQRGVVPVSSAGNEGDTSWGIIGSPADGDSVIAVGGTDHTGALAYFSSTGPSADGRIKPDVVAKGFNVFAATTGENYHSFFGTSFAAPMVSGITCQLLQVNPDLTPHEVWEVLTSTAHQAASPDNEYGWGMVDAKAAIQQAIVLDKGLPEAPVLPSTLVVHAPYPNPFVGQTAIDIELYRPVDALRITLSNTLGQQVYFRSVGPTPAGSHSLTIEGQGLPSGMYAYAVEVEGERQTGLLIHVH